MGPLCFEKLIYCNPMFILYHLTLSYDPIISYVTSYHTMSRTMPCKDSLPQVCFSQGLAFQEGIMCSSLGCLTELQRTRAWPCKDSHLQPLSWTIAHISIPLYYQSYTILYNLIPLSYHYHASIIPWSSIAYCHPDYEPYHKPILSSTNKSWSWTISLTNIDVLKIDCFCCCRTAQWLLLVRPWLLASLRGCCGAKTRTHPKFLYSTWTSLGVSSLPVSLVPCCQ